MDLERVLYKKMTKDELIDKLIAYKNIECHDRAIAHEFLCMQKEDPSRMNFVTHRLTDIADPKRVAEEIRRVKAERTASAQQPIKDELPTRSLFMLLSIKIFGSKSVLMLPWIS